jgi:ABC-type glycerol-3-phosphate transport system substrate-binding protein
VLLYDPQAFDAVGISYPQDWWGILEIEDALRRLAEYDEDGNVSRSGLLDLGNFASLMLVNLIGQGVYNDGVIPAVPDFSNPVLEDIMTAWQEMQEEALVGGFTGIDFDVPMILAPATLASIPQLAGDREFVSLPGGRSGLDVTALAVSAGTQYPELAYDLAKFLTYSPEVANSALGTVPARRSLAGIITGDNIGGGPGGGRGFNISVSPEMLPLVQAALDNGIPIAETRFTEYLTLALTLMTTEGLDARSALDQVEIQALERLQAASERFGDDTILVDVPFGITDLSEGEVLLNFGIQTRFQQLSNEADWNQVADKYAATDPVVGKVTVEVEGGFNTDVATMAEQYDCFYLPSNAVQGGDLSVLRSLDPLLSSDPTFSPEDVVGNVLSQVQRNGQTWAMPLVIQPEVMLFNTDMFNQAGAFLPYAGWDVVDFEQALRTLKLDPEDPEPFAPQNIGGTYMLSLLAAYGGIPLDFSTDPTTINFTDSTVIDAARQVLDLARDGYIKYDGLAIFGGGRLRFGFGSMEEVALYNQLINTLVINNQRGADYQFTTFPQGSQIAAIAYDVGAGYISANTEHIDACYRFISQIAQTPTLFPEMPARISQIGSSDLITAQGQQAADFYLEVDRLMARPNTILIPTIFSGGITAAGDFLTTNWLNQAFDRYVLEDADLETELSEAQIMAVGFQECMQNVPPFDPAATDLLVYFQEVGECAVQVDSSLESIFSFGSD